MFSYFLLLLLLWIMMLPSLAQAADAKAGKVKYNLYCVGCHSTTGKGDGPAASSLNPKPQDLTNVHYMNSLGDQYLFNIIKGGGSSVKKSPLMPAWGSTLSDKEIWNLVAYIRGLAQAVPAR